jgi:hypothetical protein
VSSRASVVLPAYIRPTDIHGLKRFGFQIDAPTAYQTIGKLPRGWRTYKPHNANYYAYCDGGMVERVRIYPDAVFELKSIDLIGNRPPSQKLKLPALEILPRYVVHEHDEYFHVRDRATNQMPAHCRMWQTHEFALEELNRQFPSNHPDKPDYDPTAYWQEWDDRNRPPHWFDLHQQFRRL